jgi:polar amino acid transport system substrate-binding protein
MLVLMRRAVAPGLRGSRKADSMARAIVFGLFALGSLAAQQSALAPTGRLRAAFIGDNPVQGRVDPATGAANGIAPDLARELARRLGVAHEILPLAGPSAVIEAVREGRADIGFLAVEAARAELVDFSFPYVRSTSAYLVRADSGLSSSADVDRADVRIGAVKGQSQQIYVSANVKQARVELLPSAPDAAGVAAMLVDGRLDAFAGNRQRMADAARLAPALRVLDDSFMVTEQAIVVRKGQSARLDAVNRFLDELRRSGFLESSVARAAVGGVEMAPAR